MKMFYPLFSDVVDVNKCLGEVKLPVSQQARTKYSEKLTLI